MQGETGENQDTEREVSRRTFLTYVNVAIGAFIAAILGIPTIGAAIAGAFSQSQTNQVSAGPVSGFQVGQPKAVTLTITIKDGWVQSQDDKGIWVVKKSDTDFTVYNGRCVHLGCAYSWNPTDKLFECPCHGGRYTIEGQVVAGPPPRSLDTLMWNIAQGNLVVNYEDFRLGIPQKEAV
jgi:menaquinol-cytochrome c reductase iron-sulfur subunit